MIYLSMKRNREFAKKYPEASAWLVRAGMVDELESLRKRGNDTQELLNAFEVRRMRLLEDILHESELEQIDEPKVEGV